jgi:diguanylate cyclase (GGDEF)-like protein
MAIGRVLVVDDERFFRELFADALSAAGHSVETAGSADEALSRLAEARFDLLLTDLVMPGRDGLDLVREARQRDPDLAAVAITGRQDVRLAVQAMKDGCADFLLKPIEAERLAAVVSKAIAHARLEREHGLLLSENVEFLKRQALYRESLKLLATLDLEKLQELALQVLMRLTDAQGAALWLADERGALTLRAYRGLVDRAGLAPTLDPQAAPLAGAFASGRPVEAPGAPPGEAVYVTLAADEEPLGVVLLTDRASGAFGHDDQVAAQAVGDFTGIALRNARRFQALERVGLRDKDSGAYNLSYFVDYAGKEFYKARRYGRAFSLVVLSIDNVEQLRKVGGRDRWRRALRELVGAVARVARDADILAKVSEGEYYVLLPETDAFGAHMFLRRANEEIRGEPVIRELEAQAPLLFSGGGATFPRDGEDFDELLHWARARVEAQRGSLVRKRHLDDLPRSAFWELCDLLLQGDGPVPATSPSARVPADPERFALAQREAARELARDPLARGLLYLGTTGGTSRAPLLAALPPADGGARAGDAAPHITLLGPRGDAPPVDHPLVTEVFLDGDQRLAGHAFLLLLTEQSAYAWLSGPDGRAFHTSDVPLVDALVARLQTLYDLQPL